MSQTTQHPSDAPVIVGMEHEKKEQVMDGVRNAVDGVHDAASSVLGAVTHTPAAHDEAPAAAPGTDQDVPPETIEVPEPTYILSISDSVVEKISSLAARKVSGIVDMKGSVFSLIQETFGANVKSKGVNANVVDNGDAHIELSIILEYGKSAVEVFEGLKKIINEDIVHMTGLRVARLTVNVVDVMDEREIVEKRRKETESSANAAQTPIVP